MPAEADAPAPLDLERLEAMARAATPGPWWVEEGSCILANTTNANSPAWCIGQTQAEDWRQADANAAHIAAFDPPTILALLARLQAAEREVHRLEPIRRLSHQLADLARRVDAHAAIAPPAAIHLRFRRDEMTFVTEAVNLILLELQPKRPGT